MQCLESIYCAKNLCTLILLLHERDYEFEMLLSNSFRHFRCLRTLILDCPIQKLPDAMEKLIHLRCLHMSRNVKILELPESMCNLYKIQFGFVTNQEEWVGMGGTGEEEEENEYCIVTSPIIIIKIMPRLQSFKIWDCRKLKSLPNYLHIAPLLKKLGIAKSFCLEESYQRGTGHNQPRISHIPNIKLDWKYAQRNSEPQN